MANMLTQEETSKHIDKRSKLDNPTHPYKKPDIPNYPLTLRTVEEYKNDNFPASTSSDYDDTTCMSKRKEHKVTNGAEAIVEILIRHGVDTVFGYQGGAIMPVFDALFRYMDSHPEITFVMPRHEQGSGHMAEGYAASTNKVGVLLVTSGPGSLNLMTVLQDALMDGRPIVALGGQVPNHVIGTEAFQEADMVAMTKACTKWNARIKHVSEIPQVLTKAFEMATMGRPGPVFVEIPKDTSIAPFDPADLPTIQSQQEKQELLYKQVPDEIVMDGIRKTAAALNNAQRPVLWVGNGIFGNPDGSKLLRLLADKANVPVTTTLHGMGSFDENDPKSLHMLGMHGSAYANIAVQNADVIVVLGARCDDRCTGTLPTFAPAARFAEKFGIGGIYHFDIRPENIGLRVQATVGVVGDVGVNIREMLPLVEHRERKGWFAQIDAWKSSYPFHFTPSKPGMPLKSQEVIAELNRQVEHMKDRVIVTTGVGQHQMWAAQFFRWTQPQTMITSGGLGTMGFGLPSAIGAKVAHPDKIVIDIDGDSSFLMTGMEMITAKALNVGVKVLLLNNSFQGMVKQWQDVFFDKRYAMSEMANPQMDTLAKSLGCKGLRCTSIEKLPEMMKEFLETTEPVILEAIVCKEQHVLPMVPSGGALHDLIYNVPNKEDNYFDATNSKQK